MEEERRGKSISFQTWTYLFTAHLWFERSRRRRSRCASTSNAASLSIKFEFKRCPTIFSVFSCFVVSSADCWSCAVAWKKNNRTSRTFVWSFSASLLLPFVELREVDFPDAVETFEWSVDPTVQEFCSTMNSAVRHSTVERSWSNRTSGKLDFERDYSLRVKRSNVAEKCEVEWTKNAVKWFFLLTAKVMISASFCATLWFTVKE